jgi:hypothetical protein
MAVAGGPATGNAPGLRIMVQLLLNSDPSALQPAFVRYAALCAVLSLWFSSFCMVL